MVPEWIRRIDTRGRVLGAIEADITEISAGGARLCIREGQLLAGHRLSLAFVLAEESFEVSGRVAWTDAESSEVGVVAAIGFEEMDASTRRRIVAAMNEHRRQHEPPSPSRVARRLR